MSISIKQECIELGDSSDESDHNGALDSSNFDQSSDANHVAANRPSTSRQSIHVSVHRQEITAVSVQEGTEELFDLGVDVYDQQTYERSVFDQVDRAISDRDTGETSKKSANSEETNGHSHEQQNSSNIGDLIRLIHDERCTQVEQSVHDREEEILRLARQQRLDKNIKLESSEARVTKETPILPRVPRVPKLERDISNLPQEAELTASTSCDRTDQASTIATDRRRIKNEMIGNTVPTFLDEALDDDELSSISSGESAVSEYRPDKADQQSDDEDYEQEDPHELDENAAYETDSDAEHGSSLMDRIKSKSSRNGKERRIEDDGDFKTYAARIKAYNRERAKLRLSNLDSYGVETKKLDEMVTIDGNLRIPKEVWENLFDHQRIAVRWLWELHQLGTGGILGDEMGLGKTIEMIAFLIALKSSNIKSTHIGYENLGPTVLVCPATVMHQWLQEFRKWYPPFRVAILHSTGTFSGDKNQLVRVIHKSNGILICSFPGVIIYQDILHAFDWHYAILDEGHKIKNPDSQVTLACKRFRTPHRLILSGSPVQNNLRELWSIFDFIYPGKLGTLPVFLAQFAIPITQGGYANASDMQVQIAYKCACVLRDTIKPFLLRRTKAEVNSKLKLPERSEQVLFCKLTEKQRNLYQHFLDSPTVRDIKRGTLQIFVGLIQLRKICNHPDIFDASECNRQIKQNLRHQEKKMKHLEFFSADETYGHYQKSGKMMVVDALLKLWKKQGDKVLLFTQSRQMLKIFSQYLNQRDYKHLTMDGATPIGIRHSLIDEFNKNSDIFVFLLTTKVGGVGVNLIGANRIIIYDPDWNPSTDIQARERAWRIGQQRHVIIYRLLTAGTIEEKIYHRQVFKLYLTNRILKDAKQKRFFKTNDLHELFALGQDEKNIETKALFDDDLQIDEKSVKRLRKRDKKRKKSAMLPGEKDTTDRAGANQHAGALITEEKRRQMRERAKLLSRMISSRYGHQAAVEDQQQTGNGLVDIEPIQLIDDGYPNSADTNTMTDDQVAYYCPLVGNSSTTSETTSSSFEKPKKDKSSKPKKGTKQHVDYLVKQDVYKPGKAEKEDNEKSNGSGSHVSRHAEDDYILERLFKKSNISGALKHDRIESDSTADFKVVESEAEKVARDAIRALRESRRMCLGSTSGIPNWTGRNGQMASSATSGGGQARRLIPKNRIRAQQLARTTTVTKTTTVVRTNGTTSGSTLGSASVQASSILSSIKKRNQSNPVPLNQIRPRPDSDEEDTADRDFIGRAKEASAEKMADKIREFMIFQVATRGEAQTNELLDFFKANFKTDKTAIFKAILYKMCEFQRRGDKGFWKLRSEFRNN